MFRMLESSLGDQAEGSADADMWVERLSEPGPPVLPTPPLIHGTAWWFAFLAMSRGGAVVTLPGTSYDARELLDAIEARSVRRLCIVGDAFATPILDALDTEPMRWNLVDAALIAHVKRRLAGYKAPKRVMIVESLGRGVNGKLNHRQLRDTAALLSTKA
jgi:acyl-CoA synthetase (AMP-forming)/AMP-acid ligase II